MHFWNVKFLSAPASETRNQVSVIDNSHALVGGSGHAAGKGTRIGAESGGKALRLKVVVVSGKDVAAADGIADTVIEATYTRAVEIDLTGVWPDRVIGCLSDLKSFAIHVDLPRRPRRPFSASAHSGALRISTIL